MPPGKRVALACRRPWASRLLAIQQSSMLTYLYPASRRPVLTSASAVDRMRASSMLQPKRFQLFQPMGGALIGPGTGVEEAAAVVGVAATTMAVATVAAVVRAVTSVRMVHSQWIEMCRYATARRPAR